MIVTIVTRPRTHALLRHEHSDRAVTMVALTVTISRGAGGYRHPRTAEGAGDGDDGDDGDGQTRARSAECLLGTVGRKETC